MNYNKRNQELFQEFNISTGELEYPVVVIYNNKKPYTSGDIEAFFENGTKTFLSIKDKCVTYSKTKHKSRWSFTAEEARIEYEIYIKNLLYIHDKSSIEEFNLRYEEFDRINLGIDSLDFNEEFTDQFKKSVNSTEDLQELLKVNKNEPF